MADRVTVWQCIGCGRIEAPQPCIGVCQDRKVEYVSAPVYEDTSKQLALTRRQADALRAVVRRLASTMPREGEWERCYLALQGQARQVLAALASDGARRSTLRH